MNIKINPGERWKYKSDWEFIIQIIGIYPHGIRGRIEQCDRFWNIGETRSDWSLSPFYDSPQQDECGTWTLLKNNEEE